MYIFSSFPPSIHLEKAISELEQSGLAGGNILAVPLAGRSGKPYLLDSAARTDRLSLIDGAAACGTAGMALGVIYGFVLTWGPIIWGLIGLFAGAVAGFGLDCARRPRRPLSRSGAADTVGVILLVQCNPSVAAAVEDVLWRNLAVGVGRLDR